MKKGGKTISNWELNKDFQIKSQKEFPLMLEYAKEFTITDKTIFALDETIFTNYPLTEDLLVHEIQHLKQQKKVGLSNWVYDFLHNPEKRKEYEIEAYRVQLASIKDREKRNKIRIESARNLSSDLYGNITTYDEAFKLLKV